MLQEASISLLDLKSKPKLYILGWGVSFSLHALMAFAFYGFSGGSEASLTAQNLSTLEIDLGTLAEAELLSPSMPQRKNEQKAKKKLQPKKTYSGKTKGGNTIGSDQSLLTPDSSNHYPNYPEEAKEQGIEGSFLIRLILNHKGHVKDIRFLKDGHPLLKEIILSALKLWHFTSPHDLENTELKVPIVFKLV